LPRKEGEFTNKLNKKEIKFITNPFKILNPDIRWVPGQDDLFQTAYEKQEEWDKYKDDIKTFGDVIKVFRLK